MPSAIAAVMAGSPSLVAGILISAFGPVDRRPQRPGRGDGALGVVGQVGLDLDRDPAVDAVVPSATGARMSQALRTSLGGELEDRPVDAARPARPGRGPGRRSARRRRSAPAKIVGLVVTPTTDFSLTRSARLPVSIRSRDRSSSQMETPASARAFSRSLMCFLRVFDVEVSDGVGTAGRARSVRDQPEAVAGGVGDGLAR